jgi:hypothetical protein
MGFIEMGGFRRQFDFGVQGHEAAPQIRASGLAVNMKEQVREQPHSAAACAALRVCGPDREEQSVETGSPFDSKRWAGVLVCRNSLIGYSVLAFRTETGAPDFARNLSKESFAVLFIVHLRQRLAAQQSERQTGIKPA